MLYAILFVNRKTLLTAGLPDATVQCPSVAHALGHGRFLERMIGRTGYGHASDRRTAEPPRSLPQRGGPRSIKARRKVVISLVIILCATILELTLDPHHDDGSKARTMANCVMAVLKANQLSHPRATSRLPLAHQDESAVLRRRIRVGQAPLLLARSGLITILLMACLP